MDIDKLESIKEQLLNLTEEELCYVTRNTYYAKIGYFSPENKGKIYDGSYDQISIEQASRLQQRISVCVDLFHQVMEHRILDQDYLDDKFSDGYKSMYNELKELYQEAKEKADRYDSLCD